MGSQVQPTLASPRTIGSRRPLGPGNSNSPVLRATGGSSARALEEIDAEVEAVLVRATTLMVACESR